MSEFLFLSGEAEIVSHLFSVGVRRLLLVLVQHAEHTTTEMKTSTAKCEFIERLSFFISDFQLTFEIDYFKKAV